MANKYKLTKDENGEDMAFAISCLFSGAITLQEFKEWISIIISENNSDDIPLYLYDLLNFEDALYHIFDVVGFPIQNMLTEDEREALDGIAILRGIKIFEKLESTQNSLELLRKNKYILVKFREFFPFIKIEK